MCASYIVCVDVYICYGYLFVSDLSELQWCFLPSNVSLPVAEYSFAGNHFPVSLVCQVLLAFLSCIDVMKDVMKFVAGGRTKYV